MRKHRFFRFFKFTAIALVGIAAFGFVVEQLWNWLVPGIFGWKSITFSQALGLLVLSKVLFGGFHRHGGGRGGWKRGMGERWAGMSPEERERFRTGLRGRTGCNWGRHNQPAAEQQAT